jgi:hypothetical protein
LLDAVSESGVGFSLIERLSVDVHAGPVSDVVFEATAMVELGNVGAAIRSQFGRSGFDPGPVVFVVLGH